MYMFKTILDSFSIKKALLKTFWVISPLYSYGLMSSSDVEKHQILNGVMRVWNKHKPALVLAQLTDIMRKPKAAYELLSENQNDL